MNPSGLRGWVQGSLSSTQRSQGRTSPHFFFCLLHITRRNLAKYSDQNGEKREVKLATSDITLSFLCNWCLGRGGSGMKCLRARGNSGPADKWDSGDRETRHRQDSR